MSYSAIQEQIKSNTLKLTLCRDSQPITFAEVYRLLADDPSFRTWFIDLIKQTQFQGFFFETPRLTLDTLHNNFECVLVDGPILCSLQENSRPFFEHFSRSNDEVISFKNLGGDAELIVPAPVARTNCYAHLATFMRNGPSDQIDEFWKLVGQRMQQAVSSKPVWLSTAGLGVSWLHLRIDSRPKYYRHVPYKSL